MTSFEIAPGVGLGDGFPLLILAGPCVLEERDTCLRIGEAALRATERLGLGYVFKASFDKANRTSVSSCRGPGLEAGLGLLADIGKTLGVPLVTDIHEPWQAAPAAEVVDILQIPAFLCRQTDLLVACARTGKPVNVKKGQFLAAEDMASVLGKLKAGGASKMALTERGTTFGYHNLVVDMRGLAVMRDLGVPVIFDATHSVQLPGGQGTSSGGQRQFIGPLTRAAAAVGIDGLFLETHPNPAEARSDGANSLPLDELGSLLERVLKIHEARG
ncbi:MAG: 3-deoxy-8-phosphooctulonate synthase [Lentisphaeria bacterium]|nr:3-deoxy-8-phosphooctulonate synthase [Lentisphaeria bacterium]